MPRVNDEDLEVSDLPFKHPPGFQAVQAVTVAVDAHGLTFVNVPVENPQLAMRLLVIGLQSVLETVPGPQPHLTPAKVSPPASPFPGQGGHA